MSRAVWITGARRKFHLPDAEDSAHGQKGHPLPLRIAADSLPPRIHLQDSIHPKCILVMTMTNAHGRLPGTVKRLGHGVGLRIPRIEFTHHSHFLSLRGQTDEVDRDQRLGAKGSRRTWGTGSRIHGFSKLSLLALDLTQTPCAPHASRLRKPFVISEQVDFATISRFLKSTVLQAGCGLNRFQRSSPPVLGTWINAAAGVGALLWARRSLGIENPPPNSGRFRWGAAGLALLIGGTGIAHTLPHSISGAIRFLGIAVVGLLLGNLTGRILGLQRRLDLWGRALSSHLPTPSGKPIRFSGALAMGGLLALNPLLIPAAIQDGLEHRWIGLALKSALDAIAVHAWVRSLSPIRWSLSLAMLGVILLWQSAWTVGSASAADWLQSQGISDSVMLASSLLILCSAPAIAGIRRAALANLLPTLVWIPLLNFWLRSH